MAEELSISETLVQNKLTVTNKELLAGVAAAKHWLQTYEASFAGMIPDGVVQGVVYAVIAAVKTVDAVPVANTK